MIEIPGENGDAILLFDADEMFDAMKLVLPFLTREEFDRKWREFHDEKRQGTLH